ncbi:MAG TPA: gamma-glutamyl-gamma-aminobutyrate hydrolase family protein, partial [Bacteroidales bacterium]|nr:gamma-glutamyl-gamma-aminobutyrate hydrolase family protein [Bacteroidales bacterium]
CDIIKKDSLAYKIYHEEHIRERHRHRYEFNNDFLEDFEKAGMVPSGMNPDSGLVEIMELKGHPWFVGVQFHPEYRSSVLKPHPLFVNFIKAALGYRENKADRKS